MPRTTFGQIGLCALCVALTTVCMCFYMALLHAAQAPATVDRLTPALLAIVVGASAVCLLAYAIGVALVRTLESVRFRTFWAETMRG